MPPFIRVGLTPILLKVLWNQMYCTSWPESLSMNDAQNLPLKSGPIISAHGVHVTWDILGTSRSIFGESGFYDYVV